MSDGGTLVSIHSQAENDYVYYTLKPSEAYAYIGFDWIRQKWIQNPDNAALTALTSDISYIYFENGEGYNHGQDWTGFGPWSRNGKWHDIEIYTSFMRFICNTTPLGKILYLSLLIFNHYLSLLTIYY